MKFLYPLLVALLAVFAVAPLEYPGAFQSQSGLLAYYNLIDLDRNPVQFYGWSPTVGTGYDLFRSDGPLPYFAAELLHLLGLTYLDAVKLVYALAWIASGLAMYALARRFFGEAGSLLAAASYVYLPFHIAAVYVRGAFGEAAAWAVFPWALSAAIDSSSIGDMKWKVLTPRWVGLALKSAVPFALLFLVQPGMATLFAPVAFGIAAALGWRSDLVKRAPVAESGVQLEIDAKSPKKADGTRLGQVGAALARPAAPIVGGLALGAVLALPSIIGHGANIARDGFTPNFVLPFQLFSSMWGYGSSTGSFLDQFPLQLGVAPFALAVVAAALGSHATSAVGQRRALYVFLAAALVLAVLTLEPAALLWSLLGLFASYPWQLLALVGLALAVAAGAAVEFDERLSQPAMLTFFVALPIVAAYGYLTPRFLEVNPSRPQIAVFGRNEIALLNYRIVGPLRHGATLRLELQWQALGTVDHDYTVFLHAVDSAGNTWGQEDGKPVDGSLPTIKWTPGQVIDDTHTIQINVDGPREGYHLDVGLYQAKSGDRAILDNGSDKLILPRPGDPEPTVSDQLPPAPTP